MMSNQNKKEGEFDPQCVVDIFDKLQAHNLALRALGTLLATADLTEFTDAERHEDNKWGGRKSAMGPFSAHRSLS